MTRFLDANRSPLRWKTLLTRNRRLADEIFPVAGVFHRLGKAQQLFGVDEALAERDFLGAGDLQALTFLHDMDELRRLEQRFMGAGVKPGVATAEPLDMNQAAGSQKLSAGNRKFITRRLWGVGNQSPYFHHGLFTTLRQAILGHAGEALASRQAFQALPSYEQDAVVEFLKTLQVLPPGTQSLIVDENGRPKTWPQRR